jgi:hypothetical protein
MHSGNAAIQAFNAFTATEVVLYFFKKRNSPSSEKIQSMGKKVISLTSIPFITEYMARTCF